MTEDFFSKTGTTLAKQSLTDVEVGQTYPLYGTITKFLSDTTESTVVEINYNMKVTMVVADPEKIRLLKERAFEAGIFIIEVSSKNLDPAENEYSIEGNCTTVIFGRRKENYDA